MNETPKSLARLKFDPEKIRLKYREEAEKRSRAHAPAQRLSSSTVVSSTDPFAAPLRREALHDEVDVVVVGAGFTGLVTGACLRKSGVPLVRLIDKAGGFGGVWYWSRYPGIRCDINAAIYMPLLEDVGTQPTERFAHGDEIRVHCQSLAEKFDLDEAACLQTQVTGMRWDEDASAWRVSTDRGDEIRARFVCLGNGTLDLPTIPGVPGVESFKGHLFHSSRWDYAYTGGNAHGGMEKLADKRIAVVGTAASAIQFIPHLAQYAKHTYVIQRTPVIILPRDNQEVDPAWYEALPPGWQHEYTENFTAVTQTPPWKKPPAVELIDDSTTRAMKKFKQGSPEVNAALQGVEPAKKALLLNYAALEQIRADMAAQVDDPATAEAIKPYYNLGCKRPQFSDTYLPAFNRPNVSLVDTQGRGVERLTERGIVAGGAEHEVDCVIFATGFEVSMGKKRAGAFAVIGRNGQVLGETPRSMHGIMTAGFPNLFVVGDIAQSAFTYNFTHLVAEQARYIAAIIDQCRAKQMASVEVRPQAEARWMEQLARQTDAVPKLDLACPPDEIGQILRSGYPGGASEYFAVCREWLDHGMEDDLVFASN